MHRGKVARQIEPCDELAASVSKDERRCRARHGVWLERPHFDAAVEWRAAPQVLLATLELLERDMMSRSELSELREVRFDQVQGLADVERKGEIIRI